MTPREAFRRQAKGCASLGSPFMGRLMALMAERLTDDTSLGTDILNWPGDPSPKADNVPLRLAGALHALKLQGLALTDVYPPHDVSDDRLWDAVVQTMQNEEAHIRAWLKSPPQTNEVRRSAIILAGLATLNLLRPGPVALFELGTSGGLNLRADRYRLDLGGVALGPKDAHVLLTPEWSGPFPPTELPEVVARAGVDLNPLDPLSDAGRLRLLAYLWPDQTDRLLRTSAAIDVARSVPAMIATGDAGDWLKAALATTPDGVVPVVVHTIALQYFSPEAKAAVDTAISQAASPVARLAMEADHRRDGAAVTLQTSPETEAIPLGRVDFHGRWVAWDWSPPANL